MRTHSNLSSLYNPSPPQLSVHQVKRMLQRLGIGRFSGHTVAHVLQWVKEMRKCEARTTDRPYLTGAALQQYVRDGLPRPSTSVIREACRLAGPSVVPKPKIHRLKFEVDGANHVLCVGMPLSSCSICCRAIVVPILIGWLVSHHITFRPERKSSCSIWFLP